MADIEDLAMGCAFPEAEQGLNIARNVVFLAGLPITVAGDTINRFCGSSMQSIHTAAGAIAGSITRPPEATARTAAWSCCMVAVFSRYPAAPARSARSRSGW